MTTFNKAESVRALAYQAGFDLVGITNMGPVPQATYYRDWLTAGYGGSMHYLARNVHLRENPANLLPGARSAICVALNYRPQDEHRPEHRRPTGRVAAYARGRDYHQVIREMLMEVVAGLRSQLSEPFETRICVDTAPLLERELAQAAGLGWIGKHTGLINRQLGSYLLLGEILTTLELTPATPTTDHCGSCTRCLDACPTGAIFAPHQLNAARCLSYWTIEHRTEIPPDIHEKLGDWVFGCDICQQVCPYNRSAPPARHPDLTTQYTPAHLDLLKLLTLRSAEYRRLTANSATRRARCAMWRRNAAITLGNYTSPDAATHTAVEQALVEAVQDDDATVSAAVASSLKRLKERGA
ncbi:MAG: tRNA epoxyqueuosine(34) reductase QueG [Planctomycetota bacterium]